LSADRLKFSTFLCVAGTAYLSAGSCGLFLQRRWRTSKLLFEVYRQKS